MSSTYAYLTRAQKGAIAAKLAKNLRARAKKGPKEAALDAYVPELVAVAKALASAVAGKSSGNAARAARLQQLDVADDAVDALYRHVEDYVHVEARRRHGAHVGAAAALYEAAFPRGRELVDAVVGVENAYCRSAIAALTSVEHAPTVKAIELPAAWIARWTAALDASDAAFAAVDEARSETSTQVASGQDAETTWAEIIVRLRRYVGSRAKKNDAKKLAENAALLKPLTDELAKSHVKSAARATRKKHEAKPSAKPATPVAEPVA